MNLTIKEEKLLRLMLNNAASDGEIINARNAFIKLIGTKNIFDNNQNSKNQSYEVYERKIYELTNEFNKLREKALKIEKERNELYRQNQKNYRESLNNKMELEELREKISRKNKKSKRLDNIDLIFYLILILAIFNFMKITR